MFKNYKSVICLTIILLFSVIGISFSWELLLQGRIRETFDDNIASTAYDKRYDFISEFMFGLGVHHEGRTQTLDIIGHVIQQIYSINFGLTNNAQDAALNYILSLTDNVTFHVNDVFNNYPEPVQYEVLFGSTHGRMKYYRNSFNFTGTFDITTHFSINILYNNQYSKYFYTHTYQDRFYEYLVGINNLRNLDSSLVHIARFQNEIHWDSSNITFIYYAYEWIKQVPGGVSQIHRPGVGHRYNITTQLYAELRVAPDIIFPSQDRINYDLTTLIRGIEEYHVRPFIMFSLVNDVDQRTNASLTFTYQTSIMTNSRDALDNWQINGNLIRQLFPRFLLTSSIFYGQGVSYTNHTTNRLFGITLSGAYQFVEHFSAFLTYDFTWNNTEVNGLRVGNNWVIYNGGYYNANSGYWRNRVSIGISAEL